MTFLRFIVQATSHPTDLGGSIADFGSDGSNAPPGRSLGADSLSDFQRQKPVDPFAVPLEGEANSLLNLYFSTVNLMIPCVHETSFRQMYSKLKSDGPGSVRRSWLGVLNMVFAISTNVMAPISPTHDRAARSNVYFERGMELVRADILGRLSVEMGAR